MKKIKTSLTYHHGDLANDLKKKALAIIQKQGLHHLSLRTLASKCGVSATAVYRHYKSKDHLLAALIEDGFHELQNKMKMAQGEKRLQNLGLAYIQFALHNPIQFRLMLDAFIDKSKFPQLAKCHQQTFNIVKSVVENNLKDGLMIGDVNSLTWTAWATVHGTTMLLLDKQLPISEEAALKIAYDITSIVGRGLTRID